MYHTRQLSYESRIATAIEKSKGIPFSEAAIEKLMSAKNTRDFKTLILRELNLIRKRTKKKDGNV